MDVRRRPITQAGPEQGAHSDPPFLSGSERALSCEVATCRPPAPATRALRDAGVVGHARAESRPPKKDLDFRIYFAIIRSALAVYPGTSVNKTQRSKAVAFCHFGVATLCRCLSALGDLGWKWVYIGG